MIVVDASIWTSSFIRSETNNLISCAFLPNPVSDGETRMAPRVHIAEVAGALARKLKEPALAKAGVAKIRADPSDQFFDVEHRIADASAQIAADLRLRGYDGVYAVIAREFGAALVTWDEQQLTAVRAADRRNDAGRCDVPNYSSRIGS
jgi:predicted nucleic acid-binding protein